MECAPFRRRCLTTSKFATSPRNCTPTRSKHGRPATKSSSTTHCVNDSLITGVSSATPEWAFALDRSAFPTAGAILSTMLLGKLTFSEIHDAREESRARAKPKTAVRVTAPLLLRLSQDRIVTPFNPAARRRAIASTTYPNTDLGLLGLARSCWTLASDKTNSFVFSSMPYPPSVMVNEMMRVSGEARRSKAAWGSEGACK
ncbi:hypothetical protein Mapa_011842 [Marchantia paleacea]|nr:hypothetical protein Mapa_011842 [Marchantia paleacea]